MEFEFSYHATTRESSNFQDLQRMIWDEVAQSPTPVLPSMRISPAFSEITIKAPFRLVPWIKRTIITIAPPYRQTDLTVKDKGFSDIGKQLQDSCAKFWKFGKPYTPTARDLELSFGRQVMAKVFMMIRDEVEGENPTTIDPTKRHITAILEVEKERLQRQIAAVN